MTRRTGTDAPAGFVRRLTSDQPRTLNREQRKKCSVRETFVKSFGGMRSATSPISQGLSPRDSWGDSGTPDGLDDALERLACRTAGCGQTTVSSPPLIP